MQSTATTITQYIAQLPEDRKVPINKLYNEIKKNIPKGFIATMQYGMISFVVPHSIYPDGYHCKPAEALPFISIASQKNFIAIYHMAVYSDSKLYQWFTNAYAASGAGKLDMGKSCIRFKKMDTIPFELIGELSGKITVEGWIAMYQDAFLKKE